MTPADIAVGVVALAVVGFGIFLGAWVLPGRTNQPRTKPKSKPSKSVKALKQHRELAEKALPVPSPPPSELPAEQGESVTPAAVKSLEEFPIGSVLGIEWTRIKKGTNLRIVQARGRVSIRPDRFGRFPTLFFVVWQKRAYWVNPAKILEVVSAKGVKSYKIVYDVVLSEPLNSDGTVTWDDQLEMVLADSGLDQYVVIAAADLGFQFTPTIKRVFLFVGTLALLFGLAVNGSAHLIPTTIVYWVP